MGLTQVSFSADLSWTLQRTITGFAAVTQGRDGLSFALSALDVATWNNLFAAEYTLLAAGTQVVDLRTFTDLAGNSIATADKVLALFVSVTGAAADVLNVKPDASNGLVWPFENVGYGINIPGGGVFAFAEGPTSTGTTIDATHKELILTNNGSASLTVKVAALVSDV